MFFRNLSRCLRSRCPVCGEGRLFAPLWRVRDFRALFLPPDRCAACGFRFAREAGYYFGVLTPVLPILSLLSALAFAGIGYVVFRHDLLLAFIPGGLGMGLGFALFFRPSLAIYVAIDHSIDPPAPGASALPTSVSDAHSS